jgi:hypothetical protein
LTLGHRPRTNAGSSAPIFPIVIKCASEANALKVAKLQKLLDGLNCNGVTREEAASIFVRMPNDQRVDIPGDAFFAVWVGSGVGVYYDWRVSRRLHVSSCANGCAVGRTSLDRYRAGLSLGGLNGTQLREPSWPLSGRRVRLQIRQLLHSGSKK